MGIAFLFAGSSVFGMMRSVVICLSANGEVQSHVVRLGINVAFFVIENITLKRERDRDLAAQEGARYLC